MHSQTDTFIDILTHTEEQKQTIIDALKFSDQTILLRHNNTLYVKQQDDIFRKVTGTLVRWYVDGPSHKELNEFAEKNRKELLKWFFEHSTPEIMKKITKNSQFEAFNEALCVKFPSFFYDGEMLCIPYEIFYPPSDGGLPARIIQKDLNVLKATCTASELEIPIIYRENTTPYTVVLLGANKKWCVKYKNQFKINNTKDTNKIIKFLRNQATTKCIPDELYV